MKLTKDAAGRLRVLTTTVCVCPSEVVTVTSIVET